MARVVVRVGTHRSCQKSQQSGVFRPFRRFVVVEYRIKPFGFDCEKSAWLGVRGRGKEKKKSGVARDAEDDGSKETK